MDDDKWEMVEMNERLNKALSGRDEEAYLKTYCRKERWSIDEFGAMMVGLSPFRHLEITYNKGVSATSLESKKHLKALNLICKFLDSCGHKQPKYSHIDGDTMFMSSWRYIKWVAESDISIPMKLFELLPIHLMELYLEFRSEDHVLKTARESSLKYHRALYLKEAKEFIESSSIKMTNEEIYNHPHMQRVMDRFEDTTGKRKSYKKRTITESWLPKLIPRERGRPKFNKNQKKS